jgi:glycosyltransferase involved in cell wall biosynthesis
MGDLRGGRKGGRRALIQTTRRQLIVIGPLPPPLHGVTVSTALVLANPTLNERFHVLHVDTSDHRTGSNIGRWDVANLRVGLVALGKLLNRLRGPRGVVYLPISQSTGGLARDSLYILAAAARNWRVAIHLRGSEIDQVIRSAHPFLRILVRTALSRVDGAAVMGESLRGVFSGLVPLERIAVVPNGTPTHISTGTVRDRRHVVFLSNLRRRKGVVEAVEAARLVISRCTDARFTFAGAWESPELEREVRARTRDVNGSISFLPPVSGETKAALLDSAGVLLFPPTQPEGHPRVVLEALAAGIPVVCTNRGAIAETVVDGHSGYVVPVGTPDILADRVVRLLNNPALRESMGRAAAKRHAELFSQENADRTLTDWLSSLLP